MSIVLETLNHGSVHGFGFTAGNTTRVGLGELPGISIDQFAGYSVDTLIRGKGLYSWDQIRIMEEIVDLPGLERVPVRFQSDSGLGSNLLIHRVVGSPEIEKAEGMSFMYGSIQYSEIAHIMEQENEVAKARLGLELSIAMSTSLGEGIEDYKINPFTLKTGHFQIGGVYDVAPDHYAGYVSKVLRGGIFGWNEHLGVPRSVLSSARQLIRAINAN